jgi:hypothetical protein
MSMPQEIQRGLAKVRDRRSFLQTFLAEGRAFPRRPLERGGKTQTRSLLMRLVVGCQSSVLGCRIAALHGAVDELNAELALLENGEKN